MNLNSCRVAEMFYNHVQKKLMVVLVYLSIMDEQIRQADKSCYRLCQLCSVHWRIHRTGY